MMLNTQKAAIEELRGCIQNGDALAFFTEWTGSGCFVRIFQPIDRAHLINQTKTIGFALGLSVRPRSDGYAWIYMPGFGNYMEEITNGIAELTGKVVVSLVF